MFIVQKSVTYWRIFISDAELSTFTIEQECCLGLIKFWLYTLYRFFCFWIGVLDIAFCKVSLDTFSSFWGLEAQHVCWFSHFSLQSPPRFLFSFQGNPTKSWPIINSTLRQCFNETRPVFSSAYPRSPSTFEWPLPLWQLCPAPPCPQRFSPGNSWSERELVMKVS